MAKVAKEALYLVSSEGTGYFYTLRVNKRKRKGDKKLSLTKYDPIARKHVVFDEKKLSKLKKRYIPGAATAVEGDTNSDSSSS